MMTLGKPVLILASRSPRRRELITELQLPVEMSDNQVDEYIEDSLTPSAVVEELALRKANAVYLTRDKSKSEGIIIGSDTIVVIDEQQLGKPNNKNEAFQMLNLLQGRVHEVYTGVACIHSHSGKQIVRHRKTLVKMKSLSESQIYRYIATNEPMDKAGSYAIQGLGSTLIESIEGCYFNVVGLPLSLISDMLNEYGINII